MTTELINIDVLAPHSQKQYDLIHFPGSVACFAGRRWGKTDGLVLRIYHSMTLLPGLYWWVGLSWKSASMKRAWNAMTKIARQSLRALGLDERSHINKSNHEIRIPGLGEIWFRTADNPSSLAGEGIYGVVVDEFSLMQEEVWTEYLEATLLDYGGWAAFGGVPKGHNWASVLWKGAAVWDGWLQLHATSYDNPYIENAKIDAIKAKRPKDLFRQEYLAAIVADAGSVFRGVMDCATAIPLDGPEEARQYIAGVDVADKVDFTVVSVFDVEAKRQVYLDRFNKTGFDVLYDRLEALYRRFNLTVMTIEDNSIGQIPIDELAKRGMTILPFHTTNTTKQAIVQQLASAFEHRDIEIINDPIQVGELQAFEGKRLQGGTFRYEAPSGLHDDTVMAMAIAWDGVIDTSPVVLW